jgi:hypothetical protein
MQPVDKFKLALGIFWGLFTLFGISLLFPPMDRRLREWDIKCKPGKKGKLASPNRPQRVVFLLLTSLMTAVVLADAFHRSFAKLTGISSGTVCVLMIFLPALYFALGLLKKHHKNGQQSDA